MHYKGEGVSPLYTAWAALLAENDHWQLARHGKKTYHPDPGNTVKAALAGQIGTGFSALVPGGTGLLTSRLSSLLQDSQPLTF